MHGPICIVWANLSPSTFLARGQRAGDEDDQGRAGRGGGGLRQGAHLG
jgi:hypothetical protein